ncbi:TPR repeat-containing protein [Candidatus Terasakiella magnetica]|uniref:TPR repeat-containing protein n=1 Tax=Candidatus Terasakiella magnetica TaxID=1867952 RepID=A0A1C3RIG8_9PROT|nr:tetratricopeptide repeat protein [Candidatus Terasakiella magnetica]SCA57045.1 TPR repeat-containing protein [Candidatus Terasakiella magnetica]
MKRQAFLAAFSFLFCTSMAAQAASINHGEQYSACMNLVRQAPEDAFDTALTWKGLGGGEAAEHCIATALIAMKRYKTGAERLEKLADISRRPKEFKAQILAQAAQGWFLNDDLNRARAVLSTAISLDENNAELYVDRGHIRSTQQHYKDALDDLNKALGLDDLNVDAYVFRGAVHRLTENFDAALLDINRALDLNPAHGEAYLERGMLHRIESKNDLARQDWMRAIEQDPHSKTAQTARLNLEKMDVKN